MAPGTGDGVYYDQAPPPVCLVIVYLTSLYATNSWVSQTSPLCICILQATKMRRGNKGNHSLYVWHTWDICWPGGGAPSGLFLISYHIFYILHTSFSLSESGYQKESWASFWHTSGLQTWQKHGTDWKMDQKKGMSFHVPDAIKYSPVPLAFSPCNRQSRVLYVTSRSEFVCCCTLAWQPEYNCNVMAVGLSSLAVFLHVQWPSNMSVQREGYISRCNCADNAWVSLESILASVLLQ